MSGFGIVDAFEDAARTVVDGARDYLATVGVLLLVILVLDVVQGLTVGPAFAELAADPSSPPDPTAVAKAAGQGALLGLLDLVLTLGVGFFAVAVSWDLVEGRDTGLQATWDRHGDRFLPYLGFLFLAVAIALAIMLVGLALFFLILPLFLIVPTIVYLMLRWYVAPAATLVEGRGAREAMDRSAQLTDGSKLSILGLVLLVGIVLVLVSMPLSMLTGIASGLPPTEPAQVLESASDPPRVVASAVANYVSQLVSLPLGSAAMIHVYRRLSEGEGAGLGGPGGAAEEGEVMFVPESGEGETEDGEGAGRGPEEEGRAEGTETGEVAWGEKGEQDEGGDEKGS